MKRLLLVAVVVMGGMFEMALSNAFGGSPPPPNEITFSVGPDEALVYPPVSR